MKVEGKVVAVTGGARGIGRALARRFAQEGARHVAVADLDDAGVRQSQRSCAARRCAWT